MKKCLTALLVLAFALSLAACGAGGGDGTADDVSDAPKLHLEMSKNVYEDEYRADDGTLLYSEYYELPQLELQDEEGKRVPQRWRKVRRKCMPPTDRIFSLKGDTGRTS